MGLHEEGAPTRSASCSCACSTRCGLRLASGPGQHLLPALGAMHRSSCWPWPASARSPACAAACSWSAVSPAASCRRRQRHVRHQHAPHHDGLRLRRSRRRLRSEPDAVALVAWRGGRRVLAAATVWSVDLYFSPRFWPPSSTITFDGDPTALNEALVAEQPELLVAMHQLGEYPPPPPPGGEFEVLSADTWLPPPNKRVTYAFTWQGQPLRPQYERLFPGRVKSAGKVSFACCSRRPIGNGCATTAGGTRCAAPAPRRGRVSPPLQRPDADQGLPLPGAADTPLARALERARRPTCGSSSAAA